MKCHGGIAVALLLLICFKEVRSERRYKNKDGNAL